MHEPWLVDAWKRLIQQRQAGKLPHAVLVHGPAGVGKRALLERFVASLLCTSTDAHLGACGACRACRLVQAGTHPDLHRLRPEEDSRQLKVQQIRRLSQRVMLTASEGGYQVFVVDPADRMNVNAANAFLKTLEEPRPGTLLFLLAENRSGLPVTILSRCQQIAVPQPPRDQALEWLASQGGIADAAQRERALDAAGGSPGLALSLCERGMVERYQETMDQLAALRRGAAEPVDVAAGWVGEDDDPGQRLRWMAGALRRAAWGAAGVEALPGPALTPALDLDSLVAFAAAADRARRALDSNLRREQVLETLLGDWMNGRIDQGAGGRW